MKFYVYFLTDRLRVFPRYVGLTGNPERRFRAHLRASTSERANPKLFAWVKGLEAPLMVVLEGCESEAEGKAAEARWIKRFRTAGFDLFNQRDGGTYHSWSDGARKKASETAKRQGRRPPPLTAEARAKVAQKNRERGQDPTRFIALNKGRIGIPLTPQHRHKISQALRGRALAPEHCRALSEAAKLREEKKRHAV